MGEMVASRSMQMLLHLANEHKVVCQLVQDEVIEFVLTLEKIEKLLNDDHNSTKVMDNTRKIRNLVYTIEDALEPLAVNMEVAFKPSKTDKKRGITRILIRKWFGRRDEVRRILTAMMMFFKKSIYEVGPLITWLGEVILAGDTDTDTDIEPTILEHRKSLQLLRHMYDHGMEEHFVEMEENLEKLVEQVASNDKEHRVFSILGAKGLGKTTLARNVYTHRNTRIHFEAFAWVSFDQDHRIDNLLQSILDQLNTGAVKKNAAENKANLSEVEAIKKSAKEHKKGAEENKKGAEEKNESAEEQEKGVDEKNKVEGADEKMKVGADEKKVNLLQKRMKLEAWLVNHLCNMMRLGAGRKSADDKNESAEEHKKGAEEKEKGSHVKKEGTEEQPKSSEETVMDKLQNILISKKCFIVIDGISKSSQWSDISSKFPMDFVLTKFLLTTETKIAGVEELYEMKHLNDDKGWELLKKYAFHGKKAPVLGLAPKLGKEMVGKCGGIPSKISILGRSLRKKRSFREWHEVNNDIVGHLHREAHQSQSNDTSYDLIPSYDGLSYYQKECFLYLAIFKEDECVDPEDVSFLWIAEGFCSPQQQKQMTVMDTADEYLQVLACMLHMQVDELSRKRFMPFPHNNYARELSLHLGNKEDFRLKVLDFSGGKQPRFDPYTLFDGTRRLVIHFNKLSSPLEQDLNASDDLRSLLFLNSDREYVNLPVKISDFSEFILLRVLHFVRCKFEGKKLPEGILKLLNLRYLGIIYCDLESLPSSITNVRNLHVLNVRAYIPITIPNFESEISSLKHLRLPHNSKHEQEISEELKLKLNGLLHLETLDGFNADIHDLKGLSKLKNLRHLSAHAYSNGSLESIIMFVKSHGARIRTNLVIESKCDLTSPEGMSVLEEVLMCPNLDALTFSMVVLRKIPDCGEFASEHLTKIKLVGCKLSEDPMEALGKFPNLRMLWLGYGAFVGTMMAISHGGFPNLEYLEFRCLPYLEEWRVDKGAMKKLSTLIVRKCPKLKTIPDGLESVTSLNKLEVELPPTALALAGGQDEIC